MTNTYHEPFTKEWINATSSPAKRKARIACTAGLVALLVVTLLASLALGVWIVIDDPTTLWYLAALVGISTFIMVGGWIFSDDPEPEEDPS